MKRIFYVVLAGTILAGMLSVGSNAQDQSLGDYARSARKDKDKQQPSAKKYDNDNLPVNDKLSIVGNAPDDASDKAADTTAAQPNSPDAAKTADKSETKPGESAEDRQKTYDGWKDKIAAQKNQIDLMSRELDVTQKEYQLRAAAFYADAGNRLRNQGSWDTQDAQYKQDLARKQKALDAAKKQLDDLQEQARKSGVPTSDRQ